MARTHAVCRNFHATAADNSHRAIGAPSLMHMLPSAIRAAMRETRNALAEIAMARGCLVLAACVFVVLQGTPTARAGPFEDGVAAYDRGEFRTAFELWLPLAQGGNATVQFNLATLYEKGSGVAQDSAEAARWYLEAAKQGDIDAQLKMAEIYEQGAGVPKDAVAARRWYQAVIGSARTARDAMATKDKARQRLAAIAGVTQEVIPYDYGRYVV